MASGRATDRISHLVILQVQLENEIDTQERIKAGKT